MNTFNFEEFVIEFPCSMEHQIFKEEWYYGIIFIVNESRYQIIHNNVGWDRILITKKDFSSLDLPFNEGTLKFLPEGIAFKKRIE